MIDENFMGTGFGGNILDKNDLAPPEGSAEERSASRMPKSVLQDATARVFDNTGVVMGTLTMQAPGASQTPAPPQSQGQSQPPGQSRPQVQPVPIRFTMVFVKKPQGWQMVAAHLARGPQS